MSCPIRAKVDTKAKLTVATAGGQSLQLVSAAVAEVSSTKMEMARSLWRQPERPHECVSFAKISSPDGDVPSLVSKAPLEVLLFIQTQGRGFGDESDSSFFRCVCAVPKSVWGRNVSLTERS